LCGAARPGHFRGVTTVVMKLLCLLLPDRAYFGEKDYQQLMVIARMVQDLGLGTKIVGMPIVREPDGLAMSSRNQYLDAEERAAATCLYRALQAAQRKAARGVRPAPRLEEAACRVIDAEPLARIDYVTLVDPVSLVPMASLDEPGRLCLAVRFGSARLIDNALLVPDVTIDGAWGDEYE
jgi:pantoate--beta-alanine ligase